MYPLYLHNPEKFAPRGGQPAGVSLRACRRVTHNVWSSSTHRIYMTDDCLFWAASNRAFKMLFEKRGSKNGMAASLGCQPHPRARLVSSSPTAFPTSRQIIPLSYLLEMRIKVATITIPKCHLCLTDFVGTAPPLMYTQCAFDRSTASTFRTKYNNMQSNRTLGRFWCSFKGYWRGISPRVSVHVKASRNNSCSWNV